MDLEKEQPHRWHHPHQALDPLCRSLGLVTLSESKDSQVHRLLLQLPLQLLNNSLLDPVLNLLLDDD